MFTAQAEGAGQPALRGWDTVTLWGELSANKGCATDLRVRRAPGRNQKREGEGPRELQGGRQTLPLPEPIAPPPSARLSLPGVKARMSVPQGLHASPRPQRGQGAGRRGAAGARPLLQSPPPAGLTWCARGCGASAG